MALKHVGRIKNNQRRVAVAYRTLPGDSSSCLVIPTESLDAADHDSLMKLIESNAGQNANELAEAMARTTLVDGRNMLAGFHTTGKLRKVPTSSIEMTPDTKTVISLDELNQVIAAQRGVSVDDLAISDGKPKAAVAPAQAEQPVTEDPLLETLEASTDAVLSDEDLAKSYRSQADRLSKEAAELRRQAEALVPTKKKTAKSSA